MTATAQRDQGMQLVGIVKSDAVREQIDAALPEHVSLARFERMTASAILTRPDLAAADRLTFLQSLVQCAALGFVPDGRQAAIIVDRNGKCQLRDMVGGWRDLLAQHGWTLRTSSVREGDVFDWTDEPATLTHRKALTGRGNLIAAYAIAVHRDGRRVQEVLNADQVAQRRAKAQTKTVWDEWPDEQWAKTAGRYLAKRLGLDPADKHVAVFDVEKIEPGQAAALMYGPRAAARELGQGSPAPSLPADDDGAATVVPDPEAPEPAEPSLPDGDDPTGSGAAPADDEHLRALADAAGLIVPPSGKYAEKGADGPKTLAEIAEVDGQYVAWAAKNVKTPQTYVDALLSFTAVYMPEACEAAVAARRGQQ